MRLLLDTHVFLWCLKDDARLTKSTRSRILEAHSVFVSSASIWEASIKVRLGKLDANIDHLVEGIGKSGFLELAVSAKHAAAASQMPDLHRDPFDRILIAQAITEPLKFLTTDQKLKSYSDLVEII